MSNLVQKLDGMSKIGYKVITVSDLIQRLAGLPPMMEIYVDAAGTPMFLNDTELQESEGYTPFLRIKCNPKPIKSTDVIPPATYEEALDRQRQRAMDMSAQIDRETQMHRMVD